MGSSRIEFRQHPNGLISTVNYNRVNEITETTMNIGNNSMKITDVVVVGVGVVLLLSGYKSS